MIAKTLVFVCAAFGLVAGSCIEIIAPQQCSLPSPQIITIPAVPALAPAVPACAPVVPVYAPAVPSITESTPVIVSAPSSSDSLIEVISSGSSSSASSSCCLKPGNGPDTSDMPLIQSPAVTLPVVEGPAITLGSPSIPAPKVLAQKCICTKTILRPQAYERTVTVPRIQRYIKRTVTPVVENIVYKSTPIVQESGSSAVYVPAESISGSSQARIVVSGPSCSRIC